MPTTRASKRLGSTQHEADLPPAQPSHQPPAKKRKTVKKRNAVSTVDLTSSSMSPQLFEQLVARVSTEVTKAITPLLNQRQQPTPTLDINAQTDSDLNEVPLHTRSLGTENDQLVNGSMAPCRQ